MSTLSDVQRLSLEQAAKSSVACEAATGLPAELTLAQWVLESGWGAHQPGNNCFGIKAYDGCSGVQELRTFEVVHGKRVAMLQKFATFSSLAACFEKHAFLLTRGQRYIAAWKRYTQSRDLDTFLNEIAPVYSTDPSYSGMLRRVLAMPELKESLLRQRQAK